MIKKHSKFKKKSNSMQKEVAILDKNSSFSIKEAYKTLRTNLMFSMSTPTDGARIVAIVSSIPGEGKTTTSINVASTFSETNSRVLLIDCDLRKPKLHKYLILKNTCGISNILGGFASLEDSIIKTAKGFDCIVSGRVPPNPAELLSSDKMVQLISELRTKYDYIFIDCPPVNIVSDALTIAANADGVLYVINPEEALNSDVTEGVSKFKFGNIKILGFVANAVVPKVRRAYAKSYNKKYYYYSNAYRNHEYKEDDKK